jgi:catechol 2,3-dioxygenase-like lactoylglutathione lyase family enzyme
MKPLSIESFHTLFFCRNWDACVAFYRDILAFPVVDEKRGFIEFRVAPGSRIGLRKSAREPLFKENKHFFILSLRVGNVEEVHKILSMSCKNVTAVKHHPWGARVFEVKDPEGRRLEFWTPE